MKGLHGLPTVSRLLQELDGSYFGTSLYELTLEHMRWNPEGHHLSSTEGESLTFYSPWTRDPSVRGQFKVFYYDKYPKKCIPTWTEYEVEIRESAASSLLIKTKTSRHKSGAAISLYRKDGECVYPLCPIPTVLDGELIAQLAEYRESSKKSFPALQGSRDGKVYLCHLGLASSVKWRSHTIGDLPLLTQLQTPLEQMLLATAQYDQKVSIPPSAA